MSDSQNADATGSPTDHPERDAWQAYIDANDVQLGDGLDADTLADRFPTTSIDDIDRLCRAALTNVPASRLHFVADDFDGVDGQSTATTRTRDTDRTETAREAGEQLDAMRAAVADESDAGGDGA